MESGWLPDAVVRAGMRHALRSRLRLEAAGDCEAEQRDKEAWVDRLRRSPIAIATTSTNCLSCSPLLTTGTMNGAIVKYSFAGRGSMMISVELPFSSAA